jgi:hypothetical protein
MHKYELYISIQIRDLQQSGSLNVSETVQVNANDFLSIAKILGQFHDLAQSINHAKG